MQDDNQGLITIHNLMDYLNTSDRHIRSLMSNNGLPYYRLGDRLLRFKISEIDEWLSKNYHYQSEKE